MSCQTPLATSTTTVAGDGSYPSTAVTVAAAGTYRWVAGYGGDSLNAATSISCADAALVAVTSGGAAGARPGTSTTPADGTGGGGTGSRGTGGLVTGSGSPLASIVLEPGVHRQLPAPGTPGAGAAPTSAPRARAGAIGSGASGKTGGSHGRSLSPSARHDRAHPSARLVGVLIDAPTAGVPRSGATHPRSALSTLQLASAGSAPRGGGGGSVGWLGGAILLALLVAGVLVEVDLPSLRRRRAGIT